jgi:hypothetical protein
MRENTKRNYLTIWHSISVELMPLVEACLSDRRGKVPGTKQEKEMGKCTVRGLIGTQQLRFKKKYKFNEILRSFPLFYMLKIKTRK